MSPIVALKKAIRTRLAADPALTAALGGPHIYDEVPRAAMAPYVVFAEAVARENGTATDAGHLIEMTLHVWSRQGGSAEALALADHVAASLDDAAFALDGHRLIACRLTVTETRRVPERELTRVAMRFRMVTETL